MPPKSAPAAFDPLSITDVPRLKVLLDAMQTGTSRRIDEADMRAALKRRIRGQDHVVDDFVRQLRVQWGRDHRNRPVASALFVGPTGVGKSELAKAVAEYLYGDEKALLQFDGQNHKGPEAINSLIGVPTGYVGADEGGKLTRPMLANPKRVVLFDELDKAYPTVQDVFLTMLDEGRVTEQGSGRAADFTQSVVILTSNAQHEAIARIVAQVPDPNDQAAAVRKQLVYAKDFRPEIAARIDRIYVFRPLDTLMRVEIVALKLVRFARDYGLELVTAEPELLLDVVESSGKRQDEGSRAVQQVIESEFGPAFLSAKEAKAKRVAARVGPDGLVCVESVA